MCTCVQDSRFSSASLAHCGLHTTCLNSLGSFSCPCNPGYTSFQAGVSESIQFHMSTMASMSIKFSMFTKSTTPPCPLCPACSPSIICQPSQTCPPSPACPQYQPYPPRKSSSHLQVGCVDQNECAVWSSDAAYYCRSNAQCVDTEGWPGAPSTFTCACNAGTWQPWRAFSGNRFLFFGPFVIAQKSPILNP